MNKLKPKPKAKHPVIKQTTDEIAATVRAQMASQKMTVEKVALATGQSTKTVSNIRTDGVAGVEQIAIILAVLKCRLRVEIPSAP